MPWLLSKSSRKGKKWMVQHGKTKIHFGASGYSDYTIHKDPRRKKMYLARHKPGQDWDKSGINTAGFWSRWLLWEYPDFEKSIREFEKKFNIEIQRK